MRTLLPLALATLVSSCEMSTMPGSAAVGPVNFADASGPLRVSPAFIQIPVGTSAQLAVDVAAEFAPNVEWTSFAPSIVTVDQSGVVTGLNVGVATVRVRFSFDSTNEAVATVEVLPAAVPINPDVP